LWLGLGTGGLALVAMLVCAVDARRGARQQALQVPEQRFRALTELACDWWWEQDSAYPVHLHWGQLRVHFRSKRSRSTRQDPLGYTMRQPGEADWAAHRAVLDRREVFRDFEVSRTDAQGRLMHYALSGQPVFDDRQQFVGYRGVGNDITSRREAEEATRHLAHFDALTDLPNRSLFPDRVQTEILRAQRNHRKVALLMLDLDHFKQINDTLGHDQGDALLVMAAQRLRDCVRGADTVARVGGDEFMVILGDLEDLRPVETIAGNVLQSLGQPYPLAGGSGIVVVPASVSRCTLTTPPTWRAW